MLQGRDQHSTNLVIVQWWMVASLSLALPGDGRVVVGRRLRPEDGRMRGGSAEEAVRTRARSEDDEVTRRERR
jgi:hypothetical protein